MARIFWDTNVFIYLFEKHPVHQAEVHRLRTKMLLSGDELFTSWLTVGEIQVQPSSGIQRTSAALYKRAILDTSQVLAFGAEAADTYRDIRNTTSVRGPDAMQLACAAASGVELFVTNDKRLQGLRIAGIHFIVSIAAAESLC